MNKSWGYKLHQFDDDSAKSFLRGVLRIDQSVPFIGTGFTGGESASDGAVPFGTEWMEVMRKQIRESHAIEKPSDDDLKGIDFQALSDIYFREDVVSLEDIKSTISALFTSVEISSLPKQDFLNIEWPYVYTLNIDDAIERFINGIRVLPYQAFSRYEGRRYVYKLHGDAEDVLTAPSKAELRVIFGAGDYIRSLDKNKALIADLVNDFQEKNIIFIGCSLTDEIDISYALAKIDLNEKPKKTARVYVTGSEPADYRTKKKLKDYGITDVVVVRNYSAFYSFAADCARNEIKAVSSLDPYLFKSSAIPYSKPNQMRYLAQIGWKHQEDPYDLSIQRDCQVLLKNFLNKPIAVIWGKRFSGKTTLIYRALAESRIRRCFLIPSITSISDKLYSEFFRVQDSLIAIDSDALQRSQVQNFSRRADILEKNNTTVLLVTNRMELNTLGHEYSSEAIEVPSRLNAKEIVAINRVLDPLGFQKWRGSDTILDNVFSFANSPVVAGVYGNGSTLDGKISTACKQWQADNTGKLEFAGLYYLTIRQKMYSRVFRAIAASFGASYLSDSYLDDYARKWAPFIELESTDSATRESENSRRILICNSFSWTRLVVRTLSERIGVEESARQIVRLFSTLRDVDTDAFELVLFDSLNSVYEPGLGKDADRRSAIIRRVYEELSAVLSGEPDYWLQRAKSIYYMSNNEGDLRAAVGFCEKGIVEKKGRTWANAKLTKANILGKLCLVSSYRDDNDIARAVESYVEAINDRDTNRTYIDELLRKSKSGLSYMSRVCDEASKRVGLLQHRLSIKVISEYLAIQR